MKSKNIDIAVILILMISILLSGCGPGQLLGPPFTPTSTPTITPTLTPSPTVEPPLAVSDYLVNPVIDRIDTFDSPNAPAWNLTTGTIKDGLLIVTGDGNWSGLSLKRQFIEGQGIIMNYKEEKGREWAPYFNNGVEFASPKYLQLGIYNIGYPILDIYRGKDLISFSNLNGNFRPKLDTWYQLMMVLGNGAHFLVVISEPSDPTHIIVYQETYGNDWAGISWNFGIILKQGILTIDNFMEVSFSDIKK